MLQIIINKVQSSSKCSCCNLPVYIYIYMDIDLTFYLPYFFRRVQQFNFTFTPPSAHGGDILGFHQPCLGDADINLAGLSDVIRSDSLERRAWQMHASPSRLIWIIWFNKKKSISVTGCLILVTGCLITPARDPKQCGGVGGYCRASHTGDACRGRGRERERGIHLNLWT